MGTSKKVKALLALAGVKQKDLREPLKMASTQSLSNKFSEDRWTAEDLAVVAAKCGARLAFITATGETIEITED